MNIVLTEIININRPEFINISGSSVLKKILIDNQINHNWNSDDLDIYISINNIHFNIFTCLDYIKEILLFLTNGTNNQNQFIINNISNYAYDISGIIAKEYINKMFINNNNNSNNDNDLDSYIKISENILDVIKLNFDNIKIDFIFINIEIDEYITKNFDLSIIQNYINYTNNIIQLNNIDDIKNYVSNFNLNKFNKIILCKNYQSHNIIKFIERIIKYNNRGFKIYLDYLKCSCNQINCLCSLKLDTNFINTFNQGCVNFYNINYEYNKKINYRLLIDNYNSKKITYIYENDSIVYLTIMNKIVLLRDLIINYSLHPNNLLNVFDDLLK